MELGLSLGDTPKPNFPFLTKTQPKIVTPNSDMALDFCVGLANHSRSVQQNNGARHEQEDEEDDDGDDDDEEEEEEEENLPIQLDLLPLDPVPRPPPPPSSSSYSSQLRLPWLSNHLMPDLRYSSDGVGVPERVVDVNRLPAAMAGAGAMIVVEETAAEDRAAISSSPNNSTVSSFQMDFGVRIKGGRRCKRSSDFEVETERASSRVSDDEENGSARKKLRLSKEQSAFLEESFKEHSTLNPKQKLGLAKQLNLRPRQVEVWFQNRRARTKLKQTEVDCEYLRRCCETLTEENRRLQKEVQELRALKSSQPFYMQLPATTLTMCPSCERVATTTTTTSAATPTTAVKPTHATTTAAAATTTTNNSNSALCIAAKPKPRLYPFPHSQAQAQSQLHQTAS